MNVKKVNKYINKNLPTWITKDIDAYDVEAIVRGGCASGAYMPAVTYHEAKQTMAEHGDDVFEYIFETYGERPEVPASVETWGQLCVHYLSMAVELWASSALSHCEDAE